MGNKIKISFIESSYDWHDRYTQKIRSYGIERLYGYLLDKKLVKKNGCDVVYTDFTFEDEDNINNLKESEIFAFSVMHPNYKSSLTLAKKLKIKFPQSKIIFGGPAVTDLKSEIIETHDYIDFANFGINENSFYQLCYNILNRNLGKLDIGKIPNIIYKDKLNDRVITNKVEYPPKDWENIFPETIDNQIPTRYIENQYMILGSIGCGYHCNFCNIIKSQPKLHERRIKYIVKEVKYILNKQEKENNYTRIKIQIIDQNFTGRIKEFMKQLKKNGLIDRIESIAFNSRADTFLDSKKECEEILREYENTIFLIYIGIENYDNEELKRFNKGLDASTNFLATKELIKLEKTYDNFDYILSFIGYNKNTTIDNVNVNLQVFKKLFIESNTFKNIHYYFLSPLRTNLTISLKNKERKKGYYPVDFYEYPEDKFLKKVINIFEEKIKLLPNFANRTDVFYRSILVSQGRKYVSNNSNLIWAEINIFRALLDKNEELADQIINKSKNDFVFLSQIV